MLQVLYADQPPPTGSSGHVTPYLDVANTWSAAQTFSGSPGVLTVTTASPGTGGIARLDLFRDTTTPAIGENVGQMRGLGRNSAAAQISYGSITVTILSPTAGAESSQIGFSTYTNGTLNSNGLILAQGIVGFNATGGDKGLGTANFNALYEGGTALTAKYGQLAVVNAWTANQSIVTPGPGSPLLIVNTDPGAVAGPNLDIFRDSASPAVNDSMGQIRFLGRDAANTQVTFASLLATIFDPTAGASSAGLAVRTTVAGATANRVNISSGMWMTGSTEPGAGNFNAVALYENGAPLTSRYVGGAGSGNILRRNGGLEIWQRGAGGAAAIAVPASNSGTYTADGWYLSTNVANQACTVSQVAGLTNGSQWAAKIQKNAGQTGVAAQVFGFPLDIDELYPMLGQWVMLSFTAKAGANWSVTVGNFAVYFLVGTGVPGKYSLGFTAQTQICGNNAISLTTTPTRYQVMATSTVPLNARQAEVLFTFQPVGTAGADDSFTIDDVQLEIVPAATGYVASAFQRLSFVEQLLLCQRHFFKTFLYNTAPASNVGTGTNEMRFAQAIGASLSQLSNAMPLPVPMRVAPTTASYNPAGVGANIWNASLGAAWTGITVNGNTGLIWVNGVTAVGSAAGNAASIHITADAGI